MKRNALAIVVAAVLSSPLAFGADNMTRDQIKSENDRISADFKAAKQACESRSGNAKDVCMAEAKGREKVAKAELDAKVKGTPKAQEALQVARAEADFDVAKEKCDDLSGNSKDTCVADARAKLKRAKADAEAKR